MDPVQSSPSDHPLESGSDGRDKPPPAVMGACDQCNYRKVKCRLTTPVGPRCVSCTKNDLNCTRVKERKLRGPRRKDRISALASMQAGTFNAVAGPSRPRQDVNRGIHHADGNHGSRISDDTWTSQSTMNPSPSNLLEIQSYHQPNPNPNHHHNPSSHWSASPFPPTIQTMDQKPLGFENHSQGYHPDHDLSDMRGLSGGDGNGQTSDMVLGDWTETDPSIAFPSSTWFSALSWVTGEMDYGERLRDETANTTMQNPIFPPLVDPNLTMASRSHPEGLLEVDATPAVSPSPAGSITGDPPFPSEHNQRAHLLNEENLEGDVAIYFARFRPMLPVLRKDEIVAGLARKDYLTSSSFANLLLSIVALVQACDSGRINRGGGKGGGGREPTAGKTEAGYRIAPILTNATKLQMLPTDLRQLTINDAAAAFHLYVAWDALEDRRNAWNQLQKAITIAQLIEIEEWTIPGMVLDRELEKRMAMFWVLCITERAIVMLDHLPSPLSHPIRLSDEAFAESLELRKRFPLGSFVDLPMPHLRLFRMLTEQILRCWRSSCGNRDGRCVFLTPQEGMRLQHDLTTEFMMALNDEGDSKTYINPIQKVNYVISVAWFRDRFWNISFQHGLIGKDGPPGLTFALVYDNLAKATEYCSRTKASDFDPGRDWAAKLFDMACTGVQVVNLVKGREQADTGVPSQEMIGLLYRILGMLAAIGPGRADLTGKLVKAMADIV